MVVLEHDHAAQVVAMLVNATNQHSILLNQPEAYATGRNHERTGLPS
jgi:hypothetical protein